MLNTETFDPVAYWNELEASRAGKRKGIWKPTHTAESLRTEFQRQSREARTALVWLPIKEGGWVCPLKGDTNCESYTVFWEDEVWKLRLDKTDGTSRCVEPTFHTAVRAQEYAEEKLDAANVRTKGHYRNVYHYY